MSNIVRIFHITLRVTFILYLGKPWLIELKELALGYIAIKLRNNVLNPNIFGSVVIIGEVNEPLSLFFHL